MNTKFLGICITLNKEATMFCPRCVHYICPLCKDPHINQGVIMHQWQVYSIISNQYHSSLIAQLKQNVQTVMQQTIESIQFHFKCLYNQLCDCTPNDHEALTIQSLLSKKALSSIMQCALSSKIKAMLKSEKYCAQRSVVEVVSKCRDYVNYAKSICSTHKITKNKLRDIDDIIKMASSNLRITTKTSSCNIKNRNRSIKKVNKITKIIQALSINHMKQIRQVNNQAGDQVIKINPNLNAYEIALCQSVNNANISGSSDKISININRKHYLTIY